MLLEAAHWVASVEKPYKGVSQTGSLDSASSWAMATAAYLFGIIYNSLERIPLVLIKIKGTLWTVESES